MRLIDADELNRYILQRAKCKGADGYYNEAFELQSMYRYIAQLSPIYDPDNVIAKIKEKSRVMSTRDLPHKYYKAIDTRVCEKIIRRGGVDN